MDKDGRINQILAHLASAASIAGSGVSEAVNSAGSKVEEKYSEFKLKMDLARLKEEMDKLLANVGRTMYMIHIGALADAQKTEDGTILDTQEAIDNLLKQADQKQAEIDAISDTLAKTSGKRACAVCNKVADSDDQYCSACGAKLPDDKPE